MGTDRRFDPERTAAVIREIGADVLALQEADKRFGERAGLLDLEDIGRETGLVPVPLSRRRKSHGWHGNVLLFRDGTIRDVREVTLPGVEPRGALMVDLDLADGRLRVVAAHLGLLRRSRSKQVDMLLAEALADSDTPTLLMGDLNERRDGTKSSLKALHEAFGPAHPPLPTFPSRFPIWPLDRVIANQRELVAHVEVHDTPLARVASDHLPIKAAVKLAGEPTGESASDTLSVAA